MSDILETIHFFSASDFLNYLQPRNSHWLPDSQTIIPWAFRGQCDAEWLLEPSSLRKNKRGWQAEWFNNFRTKEINKFEQLLSNEYSGVIERLKLDKLRALEMVLQVGAETKIVEEFIDLADQVGHSIPQNAENINQSSERRSYSPEVIVPEAGIGDMVDWRLKLYRPPSLEPSLAQHHGIPTRFLDWSFSPFVASFFAAEELLLNTSDIKHELMAVWAINYTKLSNTDLEVITHRRSQISYLHAQSGLFIYDKLSNWYFLQDGNWRSLDKALTNLSSSTSILRKVTLSISEAPELLRLLSSEKITRAHLMPTFDMIAKTIELNTRIESRNLERFV